MSKINAFDVLKEMSRKDIKSFVYFPDDCVMEISSGGKGKDGFVKIAITKEVARRLISDDNYIVALLDYDVRDFKDTEKELVESAREEDVSE